MPNTPSVHVLRRPPALFALIAIIAAMLTSGCSGASVVALHSPMHPNNTEVVTFRGNATGAVDRVELSYERYSLSVAADGSLTQTLATASTSVKTCDPVGTSSSVNCSHTMSSAFPASSLIQFTARAWDGEGKSSTETYSFAAGDYPLANDPIPIRLKGETAGRLDVVFIPDTDITVAAFRDQLDEVIENLYFKYSIVKMWRGVR